MRRTKQLIAAGFAAVVVAGGAAAASASVGDTAPAPNHSSQAQQAAERDPRLVRFQHLSVDAGLSPERARLVVLRTRQLYTFWDTGDVTYLKQSDSRNFVDHTLPPGRTQGFDGIVQASKQFRAAVPDLRCTVADVLVTGDRVSVRQVYTGHFTGTYNGIRGKGQSIRFIAFDIQQVGKDQIVGDWHLEDNLTFMKQIGAIS